MTDAPRTVVYEFSGFRLTPAERLLEQNGRAVSLTPKARKALRRVARVKLLVAADVTDAAGNGTTVERKVKLRRR